MNIILNKLFNYKAVDGLYPSNKQAQYTVKNITAINALILNYIFTVENIVNEQMFDLIKALLDTLTTTLDSLMLENLKEEKKSILYEQISILTNTTMESLLMSSKDMIACKNRSQNCIFLQILRSNV